MFQFHMILRIGLTDLAQERNGTDCIELCQPRVGAKHFFDDFGFIRLVVPDIAEPSISGKPHANQIVNLLIERFAVYTLSEASAKVILLPRNSLNQSRGNLGYVVSQP